MVPNVYGILIYDIGTLADHWKNKSPSVNETGKIDHQCARKKNVTHNTQRNQVQKNEEY